MAKILSSVFSVLVTLVACAMAGVAAWERGGNWLDRSLLATLSIIIVLAVHLLPSISRRSVAWLVWAGCLMCAVYGHLSFLVHSNYRASQLFSENSSLTVGTENQIKVAREALLEITARPMSVVAAELASTTDRRTRAALNVELDQSKRAQQIREDLRQLEADATRARVNGAVDPVTLKVSEFLGVTQSAVSVVIGLTLALLIELIGSVLWFEALRGNSEKKAGQVVDSNAEKPVTRPGTKVATPPVTQSVQFSKKGATQKWSDDTTPVTQSITAESVSPVTAEQSDITQISESNETDPQLEKLKIAISQGTAKLSVSGIREFLGCSQNRAMEIRRSLQV